MENQKKKNDKKKKLLYLGMDVLVLLIVLGITYAAFSYAQKGTKENKIVTGAVTMSYTASSNTINLENATPLTETEGKALDTYFDFTINVNVTTAAAVSYQITAEKDASSNIDNQYIKLYLEKSSDGTTYTEDMAPTSFTPLSEASALGAPAGEMSLALETYKESTTVYYRLRMWLDSSYSDSTTSKTFKVTVNAYSKYGNYKSTGADKIEALVSDNPETMFTDDYGNVRYTGATPSNYVTFNGETAGWRIVGVFGDNIKLVRNTSIGSYSWDTSDSSINLGRGVNDWTDADLMKLLNDGYSSESVGGSLYWNRESGNCYNNSYNATTTCDFSSTGLTSDAQNMIASTTWYLGGWSTADVTASQMYGYERGTTVYSGRPTEWTGEVGLLYPSDYGFASSACKDGSKNLSRYNDSTCTSTNWLRDGRNQYWRLSPSSDTVGSVFRVDMGGFVDYIDAYGTYGVRPAVYLNSSIKITGGSGTSADPYTLG